MDAEFRTVHDLRHQPRTSRGFIGKFAGILGDAGINIATFALGRLELGADAICLVEVDGDVPADVLDKVKAIPVVRQVKALKF